MILVSGLLALAPLLIEPVQLTRNVRFNRNNISQLEVQEVNVISTVLM